MSKESISIDGPHNRVRDLTLQKMLWPTIIPVRPSKRPMAKRTGIAAFLAAVGLSAVIAGATLYYRHVGAPAPTQGAAASSAVTARPARSTAERGAEVYGGSAARLKARAELQQCLQKAERAAKTGWDGMCATLAQHNAEQRDGCRQQGRAAADCLSSYADIPVRDCLLPHATASSIAQAQQSAKSDCYQQFQAEMR